MPDPAIVRSQGRTLGFADVPAKRIADIGDYEDGDGILVDISLHHCLIHIRIHEQEAHVLLPLEDILDAIQALGKQHGS